MPKQKLKLPEHTIEEIIEHFGGAIALAQKLGCRPNNISMMKISGFIPPHHAIEIQILTEGKFSVERMPLRRREAAAAT